MTVEAFVKRLSDKGYSIRTARTIFYDFLNTLMEVMVDGETLNVSNFGRFEVYDHVIRGMKPKWVSPDKKSGDTYRAMRFIPHAALRAAVANGIAHSLTTRAIVDRKIYRYKLGYGLNRKKDADGDDA